MAWKPPPTPLCSSHPHSAHWDSMYLHCEGKLGIPSTLAMWTYWKGVGSLCTKYNSAQGANLDTSDTLQSGKARCPLKDPSQCVYTRDLMFLDSSDLHSNPSGLPSRHLPGVKEMLAHPPSCLKGLCIPQRGLSCPMLGSGRFLPSQREAYPDLRWDP